MKITTRRELAKRNAQLLAGRTHAESKLDRLQRENAELRQALTRALAALPDADTRAGADMP